MTTQRIMRSYLTNECENRSSHRLLLLFPSNRSRQNVSKVDLTKGRPKGKVEMMRFSQFIAGEKLETEPPRNKKNTRPAEENKDHAGPSTGSWYAKEVGA